MSNKRVNNNKRLMAVCLLLVFPVYVEEGAELRLLRLLIRGERRLGICSQGMALIRRRSHQFQDLTMNYGATLN